MATSLAPSRRRVRLVGLLSRLWRFPDPAWVSLPLPVTLMRFFVPECVLFFGMASFAHIRCRRTGVVLFRVTLISGVTR